MTSQSLRLKPCPHCGGEKFFGPYLTEDRNDHYAPTWWVECTTCPAGMEVEGTDVQVLVDAWNRRR